MSRGPRTGCRSLQRSIAQSARGCAEFRRQEIQEITAGIREMPRYSTRMMETRYYQIKAEILELVDEFLTGDEFTKERLRSEADFFPISRTNEDTGNFRAMMIRKKGELFLVEDTHGGERGVFALLQPSM